MRGMKSIDHLSDTFSNYYPFHHKFHRFLFIKLDFRDKIFYTKTKIIIFILCQSVSEMKWTYCDVWKEWDAKVFGMRNSKECSECSNLPMEICVKVYFMNARQLIFLFIPIRLFTFNLENENFKHKKNQLHKNEWPFFLVALLPKVIRFDWIGNHFFLQDANR